MTVTQRVKVNDYSRFRVQFFHFGEDRWDFFQTCLVTGVPPVLIPVLVAAAGATTRNLEHALRNAQVARRVSATRREQAKDRGPPPTATARRNRWRCALAVMTLGRNGLSKTRDLDAAEQDLLCRCGESQLLSAECLLLEQCSALVWRGPSGPWLEGQYHLRANCIFVRRPRGTRPLSVSSIFQTLE